MPQRLEPSALLVVAISRAGRYSGRVLPPALVLGVAQIAAELAAEQLAAAQMPG